jgi:hypothetical protein
MQKKTNSPEFLDIVRYADKDDDLTHYATFLIEGKDGTKYVFSKSGYKGKYEVISETELLSDHPSYGYITDYYTPNSP